MPQQHKADTCNLVRANPAGFTLIELIMVIVILGILAAVALPRFYDLQKEARRSKADALLGSLRSASTIVHSAALVGNLSASSGEKVVLDGVEIDLIYGYAAGSSRGILRAANLDAVNDELTIDSATTAGTVVIDINGGTAGACTVTYVQPASAVAPTITQVITGC